MDSGLLLIVIMAPMLVGQRAAKLKGILVSQPVKGYSTSTLSDLLLCLSLASSEASRKASNFEGKLVENSIDAVRQPKAKARGQSR